MRGTPSTTGIASIWLKSQSCSAPSHATEGVDLHDLAVGSMVRLGETALVAVTGLRNPCAQIDAFRPGLLHQVLHRDGEGGLVRRAGIMGVVVLGGTIRVGDRIEAQPPPGPPRPLERV